VLTHEDCVSRLERETIGRMGVVWNGEPHVLPVNYRWMGDAVVVRTDPGTPLGNADGQMAVLEIDGIDRATRTGWSVVVRGHCATFDGPVDVRPPAAGPGVGAPGAAEVLPWAPGAKERHVRIEAESVSGRMVAMVEALGSEYWRQSGSS
jgi:hypothetical protein